MEHQTQSQRRWEKPGYGEHNLNTDVAVIPNVIKWLGFVLRDQNGDVVLAGKIEVHTMGTQIRLKG